MDPLGASNWNSSNGPTEPGPKNKKRKTKYEDSEPERKMQRALYDIEPYENTTEDDDSQDDTKPQTRFKSESKIPDNFVEALNAALANSNRLRGDLDRMREELSVAAKTNKCNTESLRSAIDEIHSLQKKLDTVTKHRDRLKSRLTRLANEKKRYRRSSQKALLETASVQQELEDTKKELDEYRERIKVLEEEKRLGGPIADAATMIRARFLEHAKRIMQLKRDTPSQAVIESGNGIAHEPNFTLDLRLFQSGLFTLEKNPDMHRCFIALYQIAPEAVPATYPRLFERARMSRALIEMINPTQPQPLGREERQVRRDLWNGYRTMFQDFAGVCETSYESWLNPDALEEFEGNRDHIDTVTRMERLALEIKMLEEGRRYP